ncbi:unnamed protein product [Trichogramma brassicae]|uniref:Uncharacterized protein n=1 Tax=Trichogramma brassicae TaxID=86971 RepID=A0A6H5HYR7_9HYME|nr:unnamed protein product [Trichogramma brassicae]
MEDKLEPDGRPLYTGLGRFLRARPTFTRSVFTTQILKKLKRAPAWQQTVGSTKQHQTQRRCCPTAATEERRRERLHPHVKSLAGVLGTAATASALLHTSMIEIQGPGRVRSPRRRSPWHWKLCWAFRCLNAKTRPVRCPCGRHTGMQWL